MSKAHQWICLLFIGISLLAGCGGGDPTGDKSVAKAKEYLGSDDRAAMIELKNALQANNENAEARWLLGKLQFDQGNFSNALKDLLAAQQAGWSTDDVEPLIARSYLALEMSEELEAFSPSPAISSSASSEILATKALSNLRQGNLEEAKRLVSEALLSGPNVPYTLLANARILLIESLGNDDSAKARVEEALKIDEEYSSGWELLGDIELQNRNIAPALSAFSKAIETDRYNLVARYKRALTLIETGDLGLAEEDIKVLKNRAPGSPTTKYLQGLTHFKQGEMEEAITELEVAQNFEKRFPLSLLYLASAHQSLNNLTQAEEYAYRYLAIDPDSTPARKLLAGIKVSTGQAAEAEELLQPIVEASPQDYDALNLMSSVYLLQGRSVDAVKLLSQIASDQPTAEAQARLGASLIALGDLNSGLDHLKSAAQMDAGYETADVLIISTLLQQKKNDEALEAALSFEQKNPNSVLPQNMIGRVQVVRGELADAEAAFEKALKFVPGDLTASQSLALLAINSGDLDKARNYYLDALKENKNDLQILLKLAALEEKSGNKKAMLETLQRAAESNKNAIEPKVLLARYFLSNGEPERVALVLASASPEQKRLPDVLNVMGLSQLTLENYRGAAQTFSELLDRGINAPQPRYHHGLALQRLGQSEKAISEFETAIALSPVYIEPRMELARELLKKRDRDGALAQLAELKKLAPENPEVLQLDASRARLDGNQQESLRLSERAFEKAPSTRNALVVSRQKWVLGDKGGAQSVLESWLDKNPSDEAVIMELANMYSAIGNEKKAVKLYEQLLKTQPENMAALNNLAWLLKSSNSTKALELAQKAVDLAPESAAALDTLAMVQLATGDVTRAGRSIERALERQPQNPEFRYHQALIFQETGRKADAIAELKLALASDQPFTEKAEAEALLAELQ